MASLEKRLARLESRRNPPGCSGLAREIRTIDKYIRRLDEEIGGLETTMSPAEVAEVRQEINERINNV